MSLSDLIYFHIFKHPLPFHNSVMIADVRLSTPYVKINYESPICLQLKLTNQCL